MLRQQIIEILNIGENCEIEFKEAKKQLPKSLWSTYSAFTNSRGGMIILGIKENRETKTCSLEGIENANYILKDFWNTINNSEKVSCNIRYHDGDYKCSKKEIKVMFSESAEESKDEMILEEFGYENINKETLENYRRRFKVHKGDTHEWSNLPDKEFLYMIGALSRNTDKLTLAGLLMFGYNRDIIKIKPSFFLDYREIDDFITTCIR